MLELTISTLSLIVYWYIVLFCISFSFVIRSEPWAAVGVFRADEVEQVGPSVSHQSGGTDPESPGQHNEEEINTNPVYSPASQCDTINTFPFCTMNNSTIGLIWKAVSNVWALAGGSYCPFNFCHNQFRPKWPVSAGTLLGSDSKPEGEMIVRVKSVSVRG